MTTTTEFRRYMRTSHPGVRFSIKTVSFQDLARADRHTLTLKEGLTTSTQLAEINLAATVHGILPDGSLRALPYT